MVERERERENMAARPMLAAASADTSESFSVLQTVSSLPCKANGRKYAYNRDVLMDIRKRCGNRRPEELNRLSKFGLLREAAQRQTRTRLEPPRRGSITADAVTGHVSGGSEEALVLG